MWGGHFFAGGVEENIENSRLNFPYSGAFYTQNNLYLSFFFPWSWHGLQLLTTIMFWFNSQRTDTDYFIVSLF